MCFPCLFNMPARQKGKLENFYILTLQDLMKIGCDNLKLSCKEM